MKRSARKKVPIRERVVSLLEFPQELVLPKTVFDGNKTLTVENYRSVIEYTDESVRICTDAFVIRVRGSGFVLRTINDDFLELTGTVSSVEFGY